jgi:DNA-binding NarL/FixJ family response regulator
VVEHETLECFDVLTEWARDADRDVRRQSAGSVHGHRKDLAVNQLIMFGRRRIVLDGLNLLLTGDEDLEVLGSASSESELIAMCHMARPHVALINIDPELAIDHLLERLRRHNPTLRIVAQITHGASLPAPRLLRAGASTVLGPDTSIDELMDALHTAQPTTTHATIAPECQSAAPRHGVSPRELDVLNLIGDGLTTAQIGPRLGISPKTVENHKQRLFAKLEVRNQAHAVSIGVRMGLLDGRRASAVAL